MGVGVAALGALFFALLVKVALMNNELATCKSDDVLRHAEIGGVASIAPPDQQLRDIARRLATIEGLLHSLKSTNAHPSIEPGASALGSQVEVAATCS